MKAPYYSLRKNQGDDVEDKIDYRRDEGSGVCIETRSHDQGVPIPLNWVASKRHYK